MATIEQINAALQAIMKAGKAAPKVVARSRPAYTGELPSGQVFGPYGSTKIPRPSTPDDIRNALLRIDPSVAARTRAVAPANQVPMPPSGGATPPNIGGGPRVPPPPSMPTDLNIPTPMLGRPNVPSVPVPPSRPPGGSFNPAAAAGLAIPAAVGAGLATSLKGDVPDNRGLSGFKPSVAPQEPTPTVSNTPIEEPSHEMVPHEAGMVPAQEPDIKEDETKRHIDLAKQHLQQGDVATARLYLQRAADAGDVSARLALGGTYDPGVLKQLRTVGLPSNADKARDIYQQAASQGSTIATDRLDKGLGPDLAYRGAAVPRPVHPIPRQAVRVPVRAPAPVAAPQTHLQTILDALRNPVVRDSRSSGDVFNNF